MPINGSGVYSLPAGVREDAVAGTSITSSYYRAFLDDIVTALNTTKPIVKGGTGGTTVATALANLGLTTKGDDLASAAELPVTDAADFFDVTGTTAITSLAAVRVGKAVTLQFDASLTLTHHATDLILPNGENIVTYAGDIAMFREYASGDWICVLYVPAKQPVYAPEEDRFVNSNFAVDLRGNAGGTTNSNEKVVEGWRNAYLSTATITGSRQTGDSAPYKLRAKVTTGSESSIAAGNFGGIFTAIEGFDVADALFGTSNAKSVYLTFKVKPAVTGTHCVSIRNAATDRSYLAEYEATAGVWNDIEIEIPGDTAGTWTNTNGLGLSVYFVYACGSTYHGSTGWQAGSLFATSNQVNGLATNGNEFEIEDPAFFVGRPGKKRHVPYAEQLERCHRLYQFYDYVALADHSGLLTRPHGFILTAPLRTGSPTITVKNPVTGTSNQVREHSTATAYTVSSISAAADTKFPMFHVILSSSPAFIVYADVIFDASMI